MRSAGMARRQVIRAETGCEVLAPLIRPFELSWGHAIDHRQPYRWARFDGDAIRIAAGGVHPLGSSAATGR